MKYFSTWTIPEQPYCIPMNGTSTAASTHSSLSRSSSRSRTSNQSNQASRTQPLPRPAIDTTIPSTYSRLFHPLSSRTQPGSQLTSRQVSTSSVASVSSSRTDTSVFSRSRETSTTATSILTSVSTSSSCFGEERVEDGVKSIHSHDIVRRNTRSQDSQRPLSPTESLSSIGKQYNIFCYKPNLSCFRYS